MRQLILELTITSIIFVSLIVGMSSLSRYTTETVTAGVTSMIMSQAQASK